MGVLEALLLGIIQGLTEFLPVSSSGHLELGAYILNVQAENNLLFVIMVHGATALSTVIVFRKTIAEIITGLLRFQWNAETQYAVKIIISMIPIAIIGAFFEEQVASFFAGNLFLTASMLAVTGLLLLLAQYAKKQTLPLSYRHAAVIGIAQSVAILPGISRSGTTISTALLLGVDKGHAARFSFLMVLPPILGAMLLKAIKLFGESPVNYTSDALPMLAGFVAAFVSGLVACSWMVKLVRTGKLIYFSIYCFIISAIALLFLLINGS